MKEFYEKEIDQLQSKIDAVQEIIEEYRKDIEFLKQALAER